MTFDEERSILWLEGADPDVVVGVLDITTEELLRAFPLHVMHFLAFGGDDEQDED